MKHIKMPKKIADQWLTDLRSGEFKQGRFKLHSRDGGYCCLGVLCFRLKNKKDSYNSISRHDTTYETLESVPSKEFLAKHQVTFFTESGNISETPYLQSLRSSASGANDSGDSFATIADAIEKELETF